MSGDLRLVVNGAPMTVASGVTVAVALMNAAETTFRSSVTGEARGPVCGMGICYECRVTIDGVPHQRACLRIVADSMRVETARVDAR